MECKNVVLANTKLNKFERESNVELLILEIPGILDIVSLIFH